MDIVGTMSFREWLWANGGITLYLTIMLVFWDIFDSVDEEEEDSEDDKGKGDSKE